MNDTPKAAELRHGVNILVILAVLTVVEFGVAVLPQILSLPDLQVGPVLIVLALTKAILVIHNFMHFPRLFAEEGGH